MHNILEARIEYKKRQINRVTVLVDCTSGTSKPLSDVRAIFATAKPASGYKYIQPSSVVSEALLQDIAGYGMETVDRDEIFPKWRDKYK